MAFTVEPYVSVSEAQAYFDNRLHEIAWSQASGAERPKALAHATRILNGFNYKGYKAAVYSLSSSGDFTGVTPEARRAAEASQPNEFPRGSDTIVPEAILIACCEIAYALLDGVDPQLELENLQFVTNGIGSVKSSFNREQEPQEHIIAGVPSSYAWSLIRPFLRDDRSLRIDRVS